MASIRRENPVSSTDLKRRSGNFGQAANRKSKATIDMPTAAYSMGSYVDPKKKITRYYSRINRSSTLKKLALCVFILFALKIYYDLNLMNWAWYASSNTNEEVVCYVPKEDYEALLELAHNLNRWLTSLKARNWLVYGSLIGALRNNNPVPWDTDVDIGVYRPDLLKYTEEEIKESVEKFDMRLEYYSIWGGFYRIVNKKGNARSDVMLYDDNWNSEWMQRTGFEAWIFFLNYRTYHRLPAKLLEAPLPSVPFGGEKMHVPRMENEALKYQFPHNWWKEVRPPGC
eukprot:Nk52_evm75s226 gene=Nk52_evmTU75s226